MRGNFGDISVDRYVVAGETHSYPSEDPNSWLVKTDASDRSLWDRVYGGVEYESASCVQQTSDGGYIICRSTGSFGAGEWDAWLVKVDSSENIEWNKVFGGLGLNSMASSVVQTADGDMLSLVMDRTFTVYLLIGWQKSNLNDQVIEPFTSELMGHWSRLRSIDEHPCEYVIFLTGFLEEE